MLALLMGWSTAPTQNSTSWTVDSLDTETRLLLLPLSSSAAAVAAAVAP